MAWSRHDERWLWAELRTWGLRLRRTLCLCVAIDIDRSERT